MNPVKEGICMDIQVKIIQEASPQDLIRLYIDAGWWKPEYDADPSFLKCLVQKSALFAGAFHQDSLIGMGRALSDMISDAYIQDVAVLKPFQRQGIGTRIIRTLIDGLKQNHVDWIGLIGEPGTDLFYTRLGFRKLIGHVPYQLTN
jgi:spermidine synthase